MTNLGRAGLEASGLAGQIGPRHREQDISYENELLRRRDQ